MPQESAQEAGKSGKKEGLGGVALGFSVRLKTTRFTGSEGPRREDKGRREA